MTTFDPLEPLRKNLRMLSSWQGHWERTFNDLKETLRRNQPVSEQDFKDFLTKISLPYSELEEMRKEYLQDLIEATDKMERKLIQDLVNAVDGLLEQLRNIRNFGRGGM